MTSIPITHKWTTLEGLVGLTCTNSGEQGIIRAAGMINGKTKFLQVEWQNNFVTHEYKDGDIDTMSLLLDLRSIRFVCDQRCADTSHVVWVPDMDLMLGQPLECVIWEKHSVNLRRSVHGNWWFDHTWIRPVSIAERAGRAGPDECSCTMTALMREGCRCGAIARERART